ncbi:MAG: LPS-assembly protein LptD, partial [Bradyrhizobiaceae bacterium]
VLRPNETGIGRLPNEDAQSLVYDDSSLFRVDKFSGWDRVEGGSRLNAGVQYTAQFNGGGFVNALVGQSYHLFGKNSFAVPDPTNTGLESGLESRRSDYVARISYQPDRVFMFTSRFRFDEDNLAVRRMELEGRASVDRWNFTMLYGNYDAQPEIGFLTRRQGVLGSANFKVTQNWSLLGAARYDVDASRFDQYRVGLGYIDDCFAVTVNYITDYTYSGNPQIDHKVLLQISLRTLGTTQYTTNVGSSSSNSSQSSSVLGTF